MILEKYRELALPGAIYPSVEIDPEKCSGCGRCVRSCPIQLLMIKENCASANDRYDHFRCIGCQNCTAVCETGAVRIRGEYRVPRGFWKNVDLYAGGKTWPAPLGEPVDRKFWPDENRLTETEQVIYNRRSIRLYRKKQVPRTLVQRVLEAGRFAPSAGNNQPWKFIVIQDRQEIDKIDRKVKQFCRLVMRGTMPFAWLKKTIPGDKSARLKFWQKALIHLLVRLRGPGEMDARARGGINAVASDPAYHTFFHAPTLIIMLADRRGIGSIDLDLGICGQNMVLAAHSLGLGTCYVSLIDGLKGFPRYRKKLGITSPFEIVTSLTLGYPRGRIDHPVQREQLRVEWVEPVG